MKTPAQIAKEIEALKAIKPKVRKTSIFGDNHHDAIDAQIDVLANNRTEGYIYDRWEPTGGECDKDDGKTENVLMAALDARRWMSGESKDKPAKDWKELTT